MGQRLGQHFLRSKRVLDRIVRRIEIEDVSTVIEVGPGEGIMTRSILEKLSPKQKLIVIEKDRKYAARLINDFEDEDRVEVVHGDALKELKNVTSEVKELYVVVGNIPYYITGKLLRLVSELSPKPKQILFLVQKEVGERVCAVAPKMNRLAASVRVWAESKIVAEVSRKYFSPPPEVDSVVLEIVPRSKSLLSVEKLEKVLPALFQQPRKMVANNILAATKMKREEVEEVLGEVGVELTARPHNLSIEEIEEIGKRLKF